jgi:hypothetical protein
MMPAHRGTRRNDATSAHTTTLTVRVFFADLRDEQRAHARASATAERMSQLEALKAIARLGLFADNVQHRVDQLGAFSVVTFRPVVTGTGLT